jgi:hypothetical protein
VNDKIVRHSVLGARSCHWHLPIMLNWEMAKAPRRKALSRRLDLETVYDSYRYIRERVSL